MLRPDKFAANAAKMLGQVGQALGQDFRGRRFSVEHLVYLHQQLTRQRAVTARNQPAIVENLRALAEVVAHGDSHDPLVFEAFLEHGMLDTLMGFARAPCAVVGHAVVVQALQSLSIITQNVRTQSSIFFLLSNSSIDSLCRLSAQFEEDEEILCNYITLLKALALNLTNTTVQFFLANSGDDSSFPLYEQAVRIASSGRPTDPMVVSAVRTIALSVYRLTDERCRRLVLATSPRGYWRQLASELHASMAALSGHLLGAHMASLGIDGRPPTAAAGVLRLARQSLEDLLDGLYYANDVMAACAEPPSAAPPPHPRARADVAATERSAAAAAGACGGGPELESYASGLTRVLLRRWLLPHVLAPLRRARPPFGPPHESQPVGAMLLVLLQCALTVEAPLFASTLALLLFAPSLRAAAGAPAVVAALRASPAAVLRLGSLAEGEEGGEEEEASPLEAEARPGGAEGGGGGTSAAGQQGGQQGQGEGNATRASLLALLRAADEPLAFGALALLAAVVHAAGGEQAGVAGAASARGEALISPGIAQLLGLLPAGRAAITIAPARSAADAVGCGAADGSGGGQPPRYDAELVSALLSLLARGLGCDADGSDGVGHIASEAARARAREEEAAAAETEGEATEEEEEEAEGAAGPAAAHGGQSAPPRLPPAAALGPGSLCAAAEMLAFLCARQPQPAAPSDAPAAEPAEPVAGGRAQTRRGEALLPAHAAALTRLLAAARAHGRAARAAFVAAAAAVRAEGGGDPIGKGGQAVQPPSARRREPEGAQPAARRAEEAERAFGRAIVAAWRALPPPLVCARGVGQRRGGRVALAAAARDLPRWASVAQPAPAAAAAGGAPLTAGSRGQLVDSALGSGATAASAAGSEAGGNEAEAWQGELRAVLLGAYLQRAFPAIAPASAQRSAAAQGGESDSRGDDGEGSDEESAVLERVTAFLGGVRRTGEGQNAQAPEEVARGGQAGGAPTIPGRALPG